MFNPILFLKKKFNLDENGIFSYSEPKINKNFQKLYYDIRKYEKRIITDEELIKLPEVDNKFKFVREWKIRKITTKYLINELSKIKQINNILDIGCGNGWLSNLISDYLQTYVIGIDNNYEELIQAKRVFKNNNKLLLIYSDLLTSHLPSETFDVIIISSAIQYFSNFNETISRVLQLLNKNGCIFIHDSIFYDSKKIIYAKKNTKEYYKRIGYPNMSDYYFHHQLNDLNNFNHEKLYDPHKFYRILLKKIFATKISPFYLIKIQN